MNKTQLLEELKQEGFSKSILEAFSKIPRENFIPKELKPYAYNNEPLLIGRGATISQPYTIAFMLELLELDNINNIMQDKEEESNSESSQTNKMNKSSLISDTDINKIKILEIGSGCGYVLALINKLCSNSEIFGIEINKKLVEKSNLVLKDNKNIKVICSDGNKGLKKFAPYDRILISAACDKIPEHLFNQLKKRKGILVCPVKNSIYQIKKKSYSIKAREFPGFVFVPLV